MTGRPYTGFDGNSRERRPGLEHLVGGIVWLSAGQITNLGTLGWRTQRGSTRPSVHCTGRAADLGFGPYRTWPGSDRETMLRVIEWLHKYRDELGLELLIDYSYTGGLGGGRTWKCDRDAWKDNGRGTISGAGNPASRWIHIELSPESSDDPGPIAALLETFPDLTAPAAPPKPARPRKPKANPPNA